MDYPLEHSPLEENGDRPTEIDGLTIPDLESRYSLARSTVLGWIKELRDMGYPMEPDTDSERRSIYNQQHIEILDSFHAHLKIKGNKISNFPRIDTRLDSLAGLSSNSLDYPAKLSSKVLSPSELSTATLIELVSAIAQAMHPPTDPLAYLEHLERAAAHDWYLSTSEVKALIGVTPKGKRFGRRGFVFLNSGKAGRSIEWKVTKL